MRLSNIIVAKFVLKVYICDMKTAKSNYYKETHPFFGRNPDEVWKELLANTVKAERKPGQTIEDLIRERKAQKNN